MKNLFLKVISIFSAIFLCFCFNSKFVIFAAEPPEPTLDYEAMLAAFNAHATGGRKNYYVQEPNKIKYDSRTIYVFNFTALFDEDFGMLRRILQDIGYHEGVEQIPKYAISSSIAIGSAVIGGIVAGPIGAIYGIMVTSQFSAVGAIEEHRFRTQNKDITYIFKALQNSIKERKWRECNTFVVAICLDVSHSTFYNDAYASFKNFRFLSEDVAPTQKYYKILGSL